MNDAILHLGLLDDEALSLDVAALELAALDHPGTALAPYADLLSGLTARLAEVGGDADTDETRAAALAAVMVEDYGFVGDGTTYDDPANADLIRVIDRRRGLPVSLSILYVAAARRVNWVADALNTPGHVLVRIGAGATPVLVDPFDRGAIVGPERLAALLTPALHGATMVAEHLAPMSNRSVLVRLLLNQATRAEAAGDPVRALALYERMTVIAPANGHGWWERARLELGQGDVPAARGSLSAMLEMTRDPGMRTHISAALDRLVRPER